MSKVRREEGRRQTVCTADPAKQSAAPIHAPTSSKYHLHTVDNVVFVGSDTFHTSALITPTMVTMSGGLFKAAASDSQLTCASEEQCLTDCTIYCRNNCQQTKYYA